MPQEVSGLLRLGFFKWNKANKEPARNGIGNCFGPYSSICSQVLCRRKRPDPGEDEVPGGNSAAAPAAAPTKEDTLL